MHAHILPSFIYTHNTIFTFLTALLHSVKYCRYTCAVTLDLLSRHFTHCTLTERHYVPLPLFLLGGGEEMMEETVTVSMVYIEPNAAEPTQDSTKNFTPRVETATVREKARDSAPRKPLRTEVRSVARQMQDF